MNLPKNIESLGKIISFGFGPDVLKGFIPAYLGKISLDSAIEYITSGKDLLANVSENDWIVLKKVAKAAKLEISYSHIMHELEETRPDLWSIILSTPGGPEWLNRQIYYCREKLDIK
jgi:hypothetical protein